MVTELEYKCRRKGHGHLNCMEIDGLFYVYCPTCCKRHVNFRDYYDFVGIKKKTALRRYLELELYIMKGGERCYSLDSQEDLYANASIDI